jgi:hypothetical protein
LNHESSASNKSWLLENNQKLALICFVTDDVSYNKMLRCL